MRKTPYVVADRKDAAAYIRRLARLVRAALEEFGIDGEEAHEAIRAAATAGEALAVAGRFVVFAGPPDAP